MYAGVVTLRNTKKIPKQHLLAHPYQHMHICQRIINSTMLTLFTPAHLFILQSCSIHMYTSTYVLYIGSILLCTYQPIYNICNTMLIQYTYKPRHYTNRCAHRQVVLSSHLYISTYACSHWSQLVCLAVQRNP